MGPMRFSLNTKEKVKYTGLLASHLLHLYTFPHSIVGFFLTAMLFLVYLRGFFFFTLPWGRQLTVKNLHPLLCPQGPVVWCLPVLPQFCFVIQYSERKWEETLYVFVLGRTMDVLRRGSLLASPFEQNVCDNDVKWLRKACGDREASVSQGHPVLEPELHPQNTSREEHKSIKTKIFSLALSSTTTLAPPVLNSSVSVPYLLFIR